MLLGRPAAAGLSVRWTAAIVPTVRIATIPNEERLWPTNSVAVILRTSRSCICACLRACFGYCQGRLIKAETRQASSSQFRGNFGRAMPVRVGALDATTWRNAPADSAAAINRRGRGVVFGDLQGSLQRRDRSATGGANDLRRGLRCGRRLADQDIDGELRPGQERAGQIVAVL